MKKEKVLETVNKIYMLEIMHMLELWLLDFICTYSHKYVHILPKGVNDAMEAKSNPRIKEAKKTGPMGVPHLAQMASHTAPPIAPTTIEVVPATEIIIIKHII